MIFMNFNTTKIINAISSSKKYNVKGCNEENYEQSTLLNKNKEYFK
jgi:hypothetical protein